MIFFCFSSKDRHTIVESIFYHVTNYAIPVWYDRHKMLMGNDRDYKNFIEGIEKNRYAVVIISHNALESTCAREEIQLIYKKFIEKEMYVFPIFYDIAIYEIPSEFDWMKKLVYKELNPSTDSLSASNHIVSKYLFDELKKYKIRSINEFLLIYKNKPTYKYLITLIESYCSISDSNHNGQIALLYAACIYLINTYDLSNVPSYYIKGIYKLFDETKLHLPIDLRESLILERIFLLLLNSSIFGYII